MPTHSSMFSTVHRSITFPEHTVISGMIELAVLVLCSRANAASNCYSFRKEKTVEKTERLMWEYTDNKATLVSRVGSCPSTTFTRLGVLTKVLGRITAKESFKHGKGDNGKIVL